MTRNILIGLLLLCCVLLSMGQYTQSRSLRNLDDGTISPADYGGLIALQDVLPAETYEKEVLPLLQKAREGGVVTVRELRDLGSRLPDLGRQTLEAAERPRPVDALNRAWENTRQGASDLGERLGRGMNDALNELSRMMDEAVRSGRSDRPAPPVPGGPQSEKVEPGQPVEI